jgi:hypothetical protein
LPHVPPAGDDGKQHEGDAAEHRQSLQAPHPPSPSAHTGSSADRQRIIAGSSGIDRRRGAPERDNPFGPPADGRQYRD